MEKYYLNRNEAVLLIIDIQDRLVPVINKVNDVIKNTNVLIDMAKEMDIPILVTEQYPKGLGFTVQEILVNLEDSNIFEKNTFSGCTKEIFDALKRLGRKKIILTGVETHVCVYQTARDLLKAGYQVVVVADGVSSRTVENYNNGIGLMKDMGAVISNTETVLFDLLNESGTPQFRVLSKLIK